MIEIPLIKEFNQDLKIKFNIFNYIIVIDNLKTIEAKIDFNTNKMVIPLSMIHLKFWQTAPANNSKM